MKLRKLLIFLYTGVFVLILYSEGYAQRTLTTQAEVEQFASERIDYASGILTITGPGITDLTLLAELEGINGTLNITNTSLTNLDGLWFLRNVDNLNINNNNNLSDFMALYILFNDPNSIWMIYSITGNLVNPTKSEIIAGGSSAFDGFLTFYTQTEVNTFNANTKAISGSLLFDSNFNGVDEIYDLSKFTNLKYVGGLEVNYTTALTSLSALNNLKAISNDLFIRYNEALTDASALSSITFVGGNISVETETDLNFIFNFSSVPGDLYISAPNINMLSNITSVGRNLDINGLTTMTNLDALSNITTVPENLWIQGTALTNINGLSNISSIGGNLILWETSSLLNLDGLSGLTTLGGALIINNQKPYQYASITTNFLADLDGLSNLTSVGIFNTSYDYRGLESYYANHTIVIQNNDALDNYCGLNSLFSSGTVGSGTISISNNLYNPIVQEISDGTVCLPRTRVTVTTSPPGLDVIVEGQTYVGPKKLSWLNGTSHSLFTPYYNDNDTSRTTYSFQNWSDGGGWYHSVTTPAMPTTYAANFSLYQPVGVDISIQNKRLIGNELFFDIYLKSNSNACYLGDADLVLDYNRALFTNPTLEKVYGNGESFCTFVPSIQNQTNNINTQNNYYNYTTTEIRDWGNYSPVISVRYPLTYLATESDFNTQVAKIDNSQNVHRLGRFKITGFNSSAGSTNLIWSDLVGVYSTYVKSLLFTGASYYTPFYAAIANTISPPVISADIRVFLEGPYNSTLNELSSSINSSLPLISPYPED
ncbi:MAG: hypothetical protein H6610_11650, partial [Ignavibacteriales bacterium]|nr:hypothetical protein [Ignavibacteriales bacterium]